jgi:hypothetical protein
MKTNQIEYLKAYRKRFFQDKQQDIEGKNLSRNKKAFTRKGAPMTRASYKGIEVKTDTILNCIADGVFPRA